MSPALLDPPPTLLLMTLEERLESAWRAVQREGRAGCPACGEAMSADGREACCGGCGARLW